MSIPLLVSVMLNQIRTADWLGHLVGYQSSERQVLVRDPGRTNAQGPVVSANHCLKEQYPVTAHAPHFDFLDRMSRTQNDARTEIGT